MSTGLFWHFPAEECRVKSYSMFQFVFLLRKHYSPKKMDLYSLVVVQLSQGHNAVSQGADF